MNEAASRVEIAALIAELSNHGDAGRIDALSDLFGERGTYTLPDGTAATGRTDIERMLSEFQRGPAMTSPDAPKYMRHNVTTSHVELIGDREARGDTYFINISDKGVDHWGRWRDRFVRDDAGRWSFAGREVFVEGMAETSWLKQSG